ncbi:MAG: hypothetical protein WCS70_06865 [Verrucomicrobiota bacterium]
MASYTYKLKNKQRLMSAAGGRSKTPAQAAHRKGLNKLCVEAKLRQKKRAELGDFVD